MTKSKYARYFVMRMLKYGSSEQRKRVFDAFEGHYPSIFRIQWAATVLENAYSDYASCATRDAIICEFYGKEYVYLKKTGAPIPTIQTIKTYERQRQIEVANALYESLETAVVKYVLYTFLHIYI